MFSHFSPRYRFVISAIYLLPVLDYFSLAFYDGHTAFWGLFAAKTLSNLLLLVPIIFYRPEFGWFHPLIFPTAIGALRTIGIYAANFIFEDSLSTIVFENDAIPAMNESNFALLMAKEQLLFSLGLCSYYLAYFGFKKLQFSSLNLIFQEKKSLISVKASAVIILCLLLFVTYLSSIGGISEHLLNWQGGRKVNLEGISFISFWLYLAPAACLVWFCIDKKSLLNPLFYFLSAGALAIMFLIGGSRSFVINVIIIALLCWIHRVQKIPKLLILGGFIVILVLTGALGNVRSQLQKKGLVEIEGIFDFTNSLLLAQQELQLRSTLRKAVYPILAEVPQEIDYLYGKSYLAALTVWIPRGLWPEKPGLIDGMVGETFYGADVGIPPGPIGEAYWNFGYIGIPIIFILFGIFHRLLYSFLSKNNSEIAFLLYITLLFNVYPVTSSIISALFLFAPIVLILLLFGILRFRWNP